MSRISCFGRGPCAEKKMCHPWAIKLIVLSLVTGSFLLPFYMIPTTVHPFMGWGVFLLGSFCLLNVVISALQLPDLAVLTPWLGCIGSLLAMSSPFYASGITRALGIVTYMAMFTPFLWWAAKTVNGAVDSKVYWEPLMAWTSVRSEPASETLMKLCWRLTSGEDWIQRQFKTIGMNVSEVLMLSVKETKDVPFLSALHNHELSMEGEHYDHKLKELFLGLWMQCADHCTCKKVAQARRQVPKGFEDI